MQIQDRSSPRIQSSFKDFSNHPVPSPPEPPPEKWDRVTFDSKSNTFHFSRPGYHYSASLVNPLKEGLKVGSVIGLPAAFGALGKAALGALGASALAAIAGPTIGATIGAVVLGKMAYDSTSKNLIYTGLAAMAGAGIGAVAFPALALIGSWGGTAGALAATAAAGIGTGIWGLLSNQKLKQKALEAGYQPPPDRSAHFRPQKERTLGLTSRVLS